MKKIAALILALIMCLGTGALLTACNECKHVWGEGEISVEPSEEAPGKKIYTCSVCGKTMTEDIPFVTAGEHEHEYAADWSKNEIYHWHACKTAGCTEAADKVEHTWGAPEIVKEATETADGELKFTCTACSAEKTESYKAEGISEDEWQAAIDDQKFDNVTIHYTLTVDEIVNAKQTHIVKITETDVYRQMTMVSASGETDSYEEYFTGDDAQEQRRLFLEIFLALLAEKDNFVYDPVENIFNAPEEIVKEIYYDDGTKVIEVFRNGKVKFGSDGRLEVFTGKLLETAYYGGEASGPNGSDIYYTINLTFSDYGTTVVERPAATTAAE